MQNKEYRNLMILMERHVKTFQGGAYEKMVGLSSEAQFYEMAAKFSESKELSERYETQMNEMKEELKNCVYDKLISCAEYAAGIRKDLPGGMDDVKLRESLRFMIIDEEKLHKMHEQSRYYDLEHPLEAVRFEWVKPEYMESQYFNSDPRNWLKEEYLEKRDFANVEIAEKVIQESLTETAETVINPLFQKFEESDELHQTPAGINRAKLMIVAGKTIEEIMREEHLAKSMEDEECPAFHEYFSKNYKYDTNRIVAAAVAADKRIEVFIPGKDGKIAEPIQMIQTGVAPKALMSVTQNAWHRFAAQFGFYKDETQRQKEYQAVIQARDRVHKSTDLAQKEQIAIRKKSMLQVSHEKESRHFVEGQKPVSKLGLSFGQGAISAIGYARMAIEGYSFEEICNPNALKEEKIRIGNEIIQKDDEKDVTWFADTFVKGRDMLMKEVTTRVNRMGGIQNIKSDPEGTDLIKINEAMFELSQEETIISSVKLIQGGIIPEEKLNKGAELFDINAKQSRGKMYAIYGVLDGIKEEQRILDLADKSPIRLETILTKDILESMGKDRFEQFEEEKTYNTIVFDLGIDPTIKSLNSFASENEKVFNLVQKQIKEGTLKDNLHMVLSKNEQGHTTGVKVELNEGSLKEEFGKMKKAQELAKKNAEKRQNQRGK